MTSAARQQGSLPHQPVPVTEAAAVIYLPTYSASPYAILLASKLPGAAPETAEGGVVKDLVAGAAMGRTRLGRRYMMSRLGTPFLFPLFRPE